MTSNNRADGMRQGNPGIRRSRGRHHGGSNGGGNGGGGNPSGQGGNRPRSVASLRHQTFDSNGPDVRVRGNAWQVYEKYQSLARDSSGSGDHVLAESYLQHAEHYYRIIEAINEATAAEQRQRGGPVQPFGQQPDVPANYYTPDGALAQPANAPAPQLGDGQQPPAQAEVRKITPPPSPFFSQDESEDQGVGAEPLVAQR